MEDISLKKSWSALILAGERARRPSVLDTAGVCCKALLPVSGQPVLGKVIDALYGSEWVEDVATVGLPEQAVSCFPEITRLPGGNSPSTSACMALDIWHDRLPLLLTTADHALLRSEMVDFFCHQAACSQADLLVGMARMPLDDPRFQGIRRTRRRFRSLYYAGCNLYAFNTPKARRVPEYWQQMERHRKKALGLIMRLGWKPLLAYMLNRLSLDEAFHCLSRRLGVKIEAVLLPWPEAAIDVDSLEDWRFVNDFLQAQKLPDTAA